VEGSICLLLTNNSSNEEEKRLRIEKFDSLSVPVGKSQRETQVQLSTSWLNEVGPNIGFERSLSPSCAIYESPVQSSVLFHSISHFSLPPLPNPYS
jgi:hypothetical protein